MPYCARRHQLKDDIAYHVINRANGRAEIFHDHEDYDMFKGILLKYSGKNEVSIYHYCIMCNHYHLLIEIEEPERLSTFMANVNRLYTVYYHKRYRTSGYLWQDSCPPINWIPAFAGITFLESQNYFAVGICRLIWTRMKHYVKQFGKMYI